MLMNADSRNIPSDREGEPYDHHCSLKLSF